MLKRSSWCALVVTVLVVVSQWLPTAHALAPNALVHPATKGSNACKGMFQCRSGRCIPFAWQCDNDTDCEHGDDEAPELCDPKKKISKCNNQTEYQCETVEPSAQRSTGRTLHAIPSLFSNVCIPKGWKCDGEFDCPGRDDEINCQNVTCTNDQHKCESFLGHLTSCIPKSWVCDGQEDCADKSDESEKICGKDRTSTLKCDAEEEFKCADNSKCIFKKWVCDGDSDCSDGSDEKDCHDITTCNAKDHFKCKSVQFCIPKEWKCDGEADCSDQSDESPELCKEYHPLHTVTCKANEFKCKSGASCISKDWQCDGDFDCSDHSDEENCDQRKDFKCPVGFKNCDNGICRMKDEFCNGKNDCGDNSDEKDCPKSEGNFTEYSCNTDTEFQCPGTPITCIPYAVLCKSNSSSHDCPLKSVCNDGKPVGTCGLAKDHPMDMNCKCVQPYTKKGVVCYCPEGFDTSGGNCVDVDECQTPGKCDQICTNLPGSYQCACHPNYKLVRESGKIVPSKCRAVGEDPLLLLSNRATIRQYDMTTNKYHPLVNRLESAVAMDYWHFNQSLIWSDVSKEQIMMCQMNRTAWLGDLHDCVGNTTNTTLVGDEVSTPDGLAVDWVHGLLFWTDTGLDKIFVLDLNSANRHRRAIIKDGLDEPRAIAVDPTAGLIFWTDWGSHARIERAGMDGNDRVEVLSGDAVRWPNGLAVDILDQRLYWADAKMKMIQSCDYYGQHIRTVLHSHEHLRHPFSLTVFEERLYWTDWDKEGVLTVNKFRGDDVNILLSGISGPMTVRVYHKQAQPEHPNKCANHNCQHLCLPRAHYRAKNSSEEKKLEGLPYVCACSKGFSKSLEDETLCILEGIAGVTNGSGFSFTLLFFIFCLVVAGFGVAGYVWNSRRSRPFTVLQFDNPVYRPTTEDPDL
ncbi:Calcium binding EGF domain-containing protein [Aphelenchoides besseyi]|nr:Calcium binding EGF domain-containing protein [Aphelenchoides besseyi]